MSKEIEETEETVEDRVSHYVLLSSLSRPLGVLPPRCAFRSAEALRRQKPYNTDSAKEKNNKIITVTIT